MCMYASKNSLSQTRRLAEKLWVLCGCQVLVPSYLLWLKGVRGIFCSQWKAQLINDPFASTDSWLNILSFRSPLRLKKIFTSRKADI